MMFHRQLIFGLITVTALCGCRGFGWMNRNDYASLHDPFLEQPVAPGASTKPREPAVVRMDHFPSPGSEDRELPEAGIVRLDNGRTPRESSASDTVPRNAPGYSPWEGGNGPSLTDFIGKGSVPAASLATAGSVDAPKNPFAEAAANTLRAPVAAVEGIADGLSRRRTAFADSAAAAISETERNSVEVSNSFSKWAEEQSQTVAATGAEMESRTFDGIRAAGNSFSAGAQSVADLQDSSVNMAEVDRLMAESDAAMANAARNASQAVADASGVSNAVFETPLSGALAEDVIPVGMTIAAPGEFVRPVPDRFHDNEARPDDQNPIPRPAFESEKKRYPMAIVPSGPVPSAVHEAAEDPAFADFPDSQPWETPATWTDSTTSTANRTATATRSTNPVSANGAAPVTNPQPTVRAAAATTPAVSPAAMEFDTGWKPFLN